MIKFTKDGFIIEVITHSEPIEAWLDTQKALIELLENTETFNPNTYRVYILLKAMLPDIEHIKPTG